MFIYDSTLHTTSTGSCSLGKHSNSVLTIIMIIDCYSLTVYVHVYSAQQMALRLSVSVLYFPHWTSFLPHTCTLCSQPLPPIIYIAYAYSKTVYLSMNSDAFIT